MLGITREGGERQGGSMSSVKKSGRFTFSLFMSVVLFALPLGGCSIGGEDSDAFDAYGILLSSSPGDQVFDASVVHQIEVTLAPENWQAIIDAAAAYVNDNREYPYYRARVAFDGEELNGDVGCRLKGHISIDLAVGHAFPLKLDFNRYVPGQAMDGLKKLNLNTNFAGPTAPMLRDFLSYEAWRQFGVAASRTAFTKLTVNGEDLGIYVMVEQVDGDFIERHFSGPYGDLYKPEQISGSLAYSGSDISGYPDIGHKWPDETDHASLLNALEVLHSGSREDIEGVFDVEGVLTYMAGNVALGSWDYYPNTGHNYYLYEITPGRFTMLPWDMNGSQEYAGLSLCNPTQGYLSGKLLEDPANLDFYRDILTDFLSDTGSIQWLTSRLDVARSVLDPDLFGDVDDIRNAIIERVNSLQEELATAGDCP